MEVRANEMARYATDVVEAAVTEATEWRNYAHRGHFSQMEKPKSGTVHVRQVREDLKRIAVGKEAQETASASRWSPW
jgi:hypothetical protein